MLIRNPLAQYSRYLAWEFLSEMQQTRNLANLATRNLFRNKRDAEMTAALRDCLASCGDDECNETQAYARALRREMVNRRMTDEYLDAHGNYCGPTANENGWTP